jgi:hypothetical protein
MTQAPEMARPGGGPPPGVTGGGPPDFNAMAQMYLKGHTTGLEGREEEFARAVLNVIKTLSDKQPYPHEVNDALVKAWLQSMQFAKDQNLVKEFIAKDIQTMEPVNKRLGQLIQMTGEKELALEAVAGWSPCHHHLIPTETMKLPGKRVFLSPFKMVLDAGRSIGQFDFDERWMHDNWMTPRMRGYSDALGVKLDVEPWNEETRLVTIFIAE